MKLCIVLSLLFVLPFMYCKKGSDTRPAPTSYLSITDVSHTRDSINTTIKFAITVQPSSNNTITVNYATEEGTAKANIDFVPASGTLTISPNSTTAEVTVQVIGRKLPQGTQQFYLTLSNAVNAVVKADKATAVVQNPGFGYQLVWSDEFNGTSLNTSDWNFETGGNGWGNNELENYTGGTNNAYIENGNLVIEAKKELSGSRAYSSARLITKAKRKFTYGKVEIRAKVPTTTGIWPALWMLGENIDQVSWPACGEIDIMELVNKETPSKVYGTAHWGTSSNHVSSGGSYSLGSGYFSDNFHVFSVEWDADKIQWFVDANSYHTITRQQVAGGSYPFGNDFFLIMNVAVGGNWPGNPDATSVFPQKMLVDYVRVYQK